MHGKAHQDQTIVINDIWRKLCEARRDLIEKTNECQILDSNYKLMHTQLMMLRKAAECRDEEVSSLRSEISQLLKTNAELSTILGDLSRRAWSSPPTGPIVSSETGQKLALPRTASVLGLFSSLSGDSEMTPLQAKQAETDRMFQARLRRLNAGRSNQHIDPFVARRLYPRNRSQVQVWLAIFAYGSPIIWMVAVICNEIYLLHSPRLPLCEPPYAVGQRGCWVATILALVSTAFDVSKADEEESSAPATTGSTSRVVGGNATLSVIAAADVGAAPQSPQARETQEIEKIEGEGGTSPIHNHQGSHTATQHSEQNPNVGVADNDAEELDITELRGRPTMQIVKVDYERVQSSQK